MREAQTSNNRPMFECSACTLRCIRAIAGDAISAQSLTKRRLPIASGLANYPLRPRRYASTAVAAKTQDDDFVPFERASTNKHTEKTSHSKPITVAIDKHLASGKVKKHFVNETRLKPSAIAISSKPGLRSDTGDSTGQEEKLKPNAIAIKNKPALMKELEWLPDRVKLAEHVHYTLRCNDPEKALDLCRLASKKEEVIVSWNHVVDWYMQKGKVDMALRVFNEMKKRAQFPDAHTYTLILRGLANKQDWDPKVKEKNVVRGVSIFNSMSSPTSRVRPSIYHNNAVLKVCAEAGDMDALWGIVAKMPDTGSAAPDRLTYSILLNALRKRAAEDDADETGVEAMSKRRNRAILDGRALWKDVIGRWRAGEVRVDEQLVVEMGRLLLTSPHMQDRDDVLNLIHQTMRIERLLPPLGSLDRKTQHVPEHASLMRSTKDLDETATEDADGYTDTPSAKAFLPVQPFPRHRAHPHRPTSLAWIQPGTHTLNMIIDACKLLRVPKTAYQYWELLTSQQYNVTPDHASFHNMLRLLFKHRASARAVALVRDGMSAANLRPTPLTFSLGMQVCVRDMKNQNVLRHAHELAELMRKPDIELSVSALLSYLMLSLSTDSGTKVTETLNHLHTFLPRLQLRLQHGKKPSGTWRPNRERGPLEAETNKQEILHLFQTSVGVINVLKDFDLVPPEELQVLMATRKEYSQLISQMDVQGSLAERNGYKVAHERKGRDLRAEVKDSEEDAASMAIGNTEPALRAFRRRQTAKVGGEKGHSN